MRHAPTTLLIIEDDDVLAELLMEYLRPHGFEIDFATWNGSLVPRASASRLRRPPGLHHRTAQRRGPDG